MADRRDLSTASPDPDATLARAETAQAVGAWMPWAAFAAALSWWGGVSGAALAIVGLDRLSQLPALLLGGGALIALLPGFLILMAGFMAREGRRASAANAIVAEAALRLLQPSRVAGAEADTLASRMRENAGAVNTAMGAALKSMKTMTSEIGDERLRLESVAYTVADNARELAQRLEQERKALEGLGRDLRSQLEAMNEAIPRQSELMVEAARSASAEVAKADAAFDERLKQMDAATSGLSERLAHLTGLAVDAAGRTSEINGLVSQIEAQLETARRTIDTAVKASEMATAAAGATGDALRDAVSSAFEGARQANDEIHAGTLKAAEDAARRLAELRDAGAAAAEALRVAGDAARAEADRIERSPATEPSAAPVSVPPAVSADRTAAAAASPPATTSEAANAADDDVELFEAEPEAVLTPPAAPSEPAAPLLLRDRLNGEGAPERLEDIILDGGRAPPPSLAGAAGPAPSEETTDWRGILADLDRSDAPAAPREATAEALIGQLQGSGIPLSNAFRPKDKRRIAAAARKGELQRRGAIQDAAGQEVDRVSVRLKKDVELRALAMSFVEAEEADALEALDRTHKTSRNASPRLAAYLLIDAALAEGPADGF